MKKFTLVSIVLLSACADYSVNTNVDPKNFKQYVPGAKVSVMQQSELEGKDYKIIRVVEGIACQEKANDRPPQEIDARNDAREQASYLNADAIVIHKCLSIEDEAHCVASISCYAKAISIENGDQ
ncbi:hypothetical protein DBZ36_13955 [Alginatibacterium sediminis]|uniref:RcsF protein n=1 Tax=Alginatibacterium sediminis TaxID=2164068 RepID=A0A420E8S7_9ALTE|nr:Rcs stress response system protein RcsF [Alginatibacterium sediminis]RKF15492.1 hypothetical protein DBZ36_13955 [Alginatibacterium sediminis]